MEKEIKKNMDTLEESPIAYVRIYPGIGIARVGNSPDEFFIGPESPWEDPNPSEKFKDSSGRVKRQAARFRIYAFDSNNNVKGEITARDGIQINWAVHLCNKKSSYYQFAGRYNQIFAPSNLRNNADNKDNRTPDERSEWIIDPGVKTISGIKQATVLLEGGKIKDQPVSLGELQTDEKGRLLVLGGKGHSASLIPDNPVTDFANNDNWHDDTSDGTINATVIFTGGKELIADPAWVLVTPPKFAPNHYNLVSLYDKIKERSATDSINEETCFYKHIYPILFRASNFAWINAMAYRGHGAGKNGNFIDPPALKILSANTDSIKIIVPDPIQPPPATITETINCKEARKAIFDRIRKPLKIKDPFKAYSSDQNVKAISDEDQKLMNSQANYKYMPQLSGDDGDALTFGSITGDEAYDKRPPFLTWLTVTEVQYKHLENWKEGKFKVDSPEVYIPLEEYPLSEQPAMLERGVLEPCVGGPFFPGIEMTFLSDEPATFRSPFRIQTTFKPGDITRIMACPWQADFFECNTHWWPAERPDDIATEEAFEEAKKLLAKYDSDNSENEDDDQLDPYRSYALTMADRLMWARGVENDPNNNSEGDNRMVKYWHELGFITKRLAPPVTYKGKEFRETVYVEQERDPYAGLLTERQLFYMIQDIENYPGILPKVKDYVESVLADARAYGNADNTPEEMKYFMYTRDNFESRMMDVYNSFVNDEVNYDPATDPVFRNRQSMITYFIQMAPFNLTDGAWLRRIDKAGPSDDVQSLLSSIWQDERGNGNPFMNHCNIYLDLLHSIGYYPKDVESEAFSQDPDFFDSAFSVPAFELAISQFTESYMPEIMGMSLYLEWSVNDLKNTIKQMEYYGFNTHFFVMHVGIDNAVNGHGRRALDAIKLYLDEINNQGGENAVQELFERIWTGYIAFSFTGNLGQDIQDAVLTPPDYHKQVMAMISRKAEIGSLNHDQHMIGANKINDWFSEPEGFMQALIDAAYIVPGNVSGSRFFSLLEFQTGPMFRVFTDPEIQLWKDWTNSLVPQTGIPVVNSVDAMIKLVNTLKNQQAGNAQHKVMQLLQPGTDTPHPISWWFTQPPLEFMAALRYGKNGFIIPYDPDNSIFVTQLIAPANAMGQAFNYVIPGTGKLTGPDDQSGPAVVKDQTGREVVINWINDGCPLGFHPEEKVFTNVLPIPVGKEKIYLRSSLKKRKSLSQKIHGMGAIH